MFGHLERIMSLVHWSLSESVDGKMAAIIYCFIVLFGGDEARSGYVQYAPVVSSHFTQLTMHILNS